MSRTSELRLHTPGAHCRFECRRHLSVTMDTTLPVTGIEAATDLALISSFDWGIKLGMVKQYQSLVFGPPWRRRRPDVWMSTPRASRGATAETTPESQRGNVQFCKCRQSRDGYKSWAPCTLFGNTASDMGAGYKSWAQSRRGVKARNFQKHAWKRLCSRSQSEKSGFSASQHQTQRTLSEALGSGEGAQVCCSRLVCQASNLDFLDQSR